MQTSHRTPSSNVIIVLSALWLIGVFLISCDGRQCDSHSDCLGDYRRCCSGYCRRLCNLSCSGDEHCGSPGSIEEYCCKGRCISESTVCEKPLPEEEPILSTAVIAVIAIFGMILILALLCFVLRSYWYKCLGICSKARGSPQRQIGAKLRGSNGFVELGRGSSVNGADETLIRPERISTQSSTSWVGQDVRIIPPKSSGSARNGQSKAKQNNIKTMVS